MSKSKSVFTCQNCGAQSPKWIGRCPSCGEWNTYVEELVATTKKTVSKSVTIEGRKPLILDDIEAAKIPRIQTNTEEFNRVLGGGIVPGSL
ncbi:MAG: DNA repair protein RadA, partial [Prolixibacteraceae bacterium]|nr:DNA repair protein RadA [Prolixibacteraceae bacterium]MBN2774010.1 DNA repair protein RadA [Prolixibacteraceae bacterium]